jgi:hypothetical protein
MTPFQEFFQNYGPYLWLILLLLVLGLAYSFYRFQTRYRKDYQQLDALLRANGDEGGLEKLLDRLSSLERDAAMLDVMQTAMRELELRQNQSFQSVGLVRFNPFTDMGGDQSFALSIVDSYGNGFVLSSLHGRTATRVYAKTVRRGQSTQTVSTEEQAAIDQAMRFQQLPPDTPIQA